MKFKANISLKLAGFLLAICIPPFLLYQILTFSIVRDTMVEMASKNSMNLLIDQEVYLSQQLDHIEDLLRNISAIEEIKQAIRRADAEASGTPLRSAQSDPISTIDQISTQTRISTILSGYSSLNGLVSLDIFSAGGQHYHVGDTLSSRYVNTTQLNQLIRESRQAGSNIYWHGIRSNINNSSDQHQVIVASKTLWDTRQTMDSGTPRRLGTLLVNYEPTALYRHLDRLEMGRGSRLLVVDRARRLLYHPDATLIGQPVAPSLGQLLTGEAGSLTVDLAGQPTLLNYRRLPAQNWYIISTVPRDELLAPLRHITQTGTALLAGILVLLVWPSRLFDRRIIQPIRALSDGFRDFQAKRLAPDWRMPPMKSLSEISELAGWFNTFLDSMENQRQAEADLRAAATAFEAQEGMVITDTDTRIVRVNYAFSNISGYSAREVLGKPIRMLKSGQHDAAFYQSMWQSIQDNDNWHGEVWNQRRNGEIYPCWLTITVVRDPQGTITNYVGTIIDITQRKQAEEEIERLAYYDPLTHLPNRRLLLDRLRQACVASGQNQQVGALLFIDMDNFKFLNDTQGHDKGDQLLQQVASRLRNQVRETDTVSRLGGDEFVVMLEGLGADIADAATYARSIGDKVLASLQAPYELGSYVHHCTSSMGVTLFRGRDNSVEEILKQADLAMYEAKAAGRNTLRFFDQTMQKAVDERADLEGHLHQAIERQQLELHYQIQVDDDGQVLGAEALLRWHHPQHGMMSPAVFIPVAEQSDLIVRFGNWVLETACRRLVQWAADPALARLTLAVNVSARQFRQPEFVGHVLRILENTRAPVSRLKLELTESLLIGDIHDTISKMNTLKAHGIGFSLDDFGTGYSSLNYLRRLPLDQLKIDRSFVSDVAQEPVDAAIVRTILALANTMGLAVIAEGVETEAQRTFPTRLGCHAYQGYLFGRPLPEDKFLALVRLWQAERAGMAPSHA